MASAHPLVQLLLSRPELFTEHGAAYVEWVSTELLAAQSRWQRRIRLQLLSGVALVMGLLLSGQVLMWATVLSLDLWRWLCLVPALPLLVAAWAGWAAGHPPATTPLPWLALRQQWAQDWALIRDSAPGASRASGA